MHFCDLANSFSKITTFLLSHTEERAEETPGEIFLNKETISWFRILMKTWLLHCSVNSDNSLHFFVKEGLLDDIPSQVCNYTDTAFLPSHQTLTLFKFLLTFIQIQDWMRLGEVGHDIMNYQCQGLRLRQITQTRGLIIHYIMRKPNSIIVLFYIF